MLLKHTCKQNINSHKIRSDIALLCWISFISTVSDAFIAICCISSLLVIKAKLNNEFSTSCICDAHNISITDTSASYLSCFSSSSFFAFDSSVCISATTISFFTAISSSNVKVSSHMTSSGRSSKFHLKIEAVW